MRFDLDTVAMATLLVKVERLDLKGLRGRLVYYHRASRMAISLTAISICRV